MLTNYQYFYFRFKKRFVNIEKQKKQKTNKDEHLRVQCNNR